MLLAAEQLKLKQILSEAILLLCKSGLPFDSELSVQALVGITLDQSEVCLISVHEVAHAADKPQSSGSGRCELLETSTAEDEPQLRKSPTSENSLHDRSGDSALLLDNGNSAQTLSRFREKNLQKMFSFNKFSQKYAKGFDLISSTSCSNDSSRKRSSLGKRSSHLSSLDEAHINLLNNHGSSANEAEKATGINKRHRYSISADGNMLSVPKQHLNSTQSYDCRTKTSSDCPRPSKDIVLTKQASCLTADHQVGDSNDPRHTASDALLIGGVEIKIEQDEEAEEHKNDVSPMNFMESFQDRGGSFFPSADDILALGQNAVNDMSLSFLGKHRNPVSILDGNSSDQQQVDVSVSALVCHHVLKYEGPFVPVRDIQRRRLRQVSAHVIKSAMNQLMSDGLGYYKMIGLGIMVFYKCPPSLIDPDVLQKYGMSHEYYQQTYNETLYITSSNRHSDNYWERITLASPYSYDAS